MAIPHIQSALPKKRYKYGEFIVTLLTDVVSHDNVQYMYLVAVLSEGENNPQVYITYEQTTQNSYQTRVVSAQDEHIIASQQARMTESAFCEFALADIEQMFGLSDETPAAIWLIRWSGSFLISLGICCNHD